jgi:multisubunit Na+/H+ antiporter MnhE subunit
MIVAIVVAGLTVIYVSALGRFAWQDFALGFLLSCGLLWIFRAITLQGHRESSAWTIRTLIQTPRYIMLVIGDVVTGTWQVATYVVGLRQLDHPGIIRIPYEEESQIRLGIALLAIAVSPGSSVVDVNQEERYILVHFIDISDPDRLREEIHRKYLNVPGTHAYEKENGSHA